MNQIVNSFKQNIPLPIRLFLGKALLFFIVWKLIYSLFLFNSQLADFHLTKHVGNGSAFFLNLISSESNYTSIIETYNSEIDGEFIVNKVAAIYNNNQQVLHLSLIHI